jgi:general nucleoside transport system permease protein
MTPPPTSAEPGPMRRLTHSLLGPKEDRSSPTIYRLGRMTGPIILSVALGLLLAGLAVRLLGTSPAQFFSQLFHGTLGSGYGLSQVLFKATPLMFTGMAVALAFQAGLFNIGAEGQMAIGGFAMAWVGFSIPGLPFPVGVLIALTAGAVGGGLWAAVPGLLKSRTGGSEVIVTIMLNFIAAALINYLLVHRFALPETVRTPEISSGFSLPRFSDSIPSLHGSPLNGGLILALLVAFLLHFLMGQTPLGFSLKVLGEGPAQARYAGLPVSRLTVIGMTLSGAVAGLAGASFILGYKHYYEAEFSAGAGFTGIAVALLARNRPLAVIPSAVFFGVLSYGGLVVNSLVPRELLDVLQAVILVLFIVFDRWFARLFARRWEPQALPAPPADGLTLGEP